MTTHGERQLVRTGVELLAMVKSHAERDAVSLTSFANVIEVRGDSLLIESSRIFEVGDSVTIRLSFPGISRGSTPVVSFACVVEGTRDASNLHYDVRIREMNEPARRQLGEFLEKPDIGGEG